MIGREPGLAIGTPLRQSGQSPADQVSKFAETRWRLGSGAKGRGSPERLTSEADAEDLAAEGPEDGDHLAGRLSGRHDVLDHHHPLTRCETEAPPQNHPTFRAFGEEKGHVEGASGLVADDEAAHGRSDDEVRRHSRRADRRRELAAGAGGAARVGEIEGALQIVARVEPRRQQEMAVLVGAAFGELGNRHRLAQSASRSMP